MDVVDKERMDDSEIFKIEDYKRNFLTHYDLLRRRYTHFKDINDKCNNGKLNIKDPDVYCDVITYLDMIMVQLRAMCLENTKNNNNYTVQVLAKRVGKDIESSLDAILGQNFVLGLTTRDVLKYFVDKYICHYDNCDILSNNSYGMDLAGNIEIQLRNPHAQVNLDKVINPIFGIVDSLLLGIC